MKVVVGGYRVTKLRPEKPSVPTNKSSCSLRSTIRFPSPCPQNRSLGRANPVRTTFRLRLPLRGYVRYVILTAELRAAGDEEMTDKVSEPLGDQLQRVIAKGLTKLESERAICDGISAGKITIYRRIEKIDFKRKQPLHQSQSLLVEPSEVFIS